MPKGQKDNANCTVGTAREKEVRLKSCSDLKDLGGLTRSFASVRRSSTSEKLKLASVMNWLTTDTNLSPAC